jgi:hypothetical protein
VGVVQESVFGFTVQAKLEDDSSAAEEVWVKVTVPSGL